MLFMVGDVWLLRVFAVLCGGGGWCCPDSEDAEASLWDMLAAALEANQEMARLAAELREENARLRAENARQAAELENLRAGTDQAPPVLPSRGMFRSRTR
jgi:hypothetical protein